MATKSVLVVDDDPGVHELLRGVLSEPEWAMASAYDGLEGLACVEDGGYDLVITDIRMPGMDGLELLRKIRQIRPETKVMVMTGESTPSDLIASLRERAFSYFSKPFSPARVREMVADADEALSWQGDIELLSARPEWLGLRVRCNEGAGGRVVHFLRELKMDLPEKQRDQIAAAFHEMLRNAMEHGAANDPRAWIYVGYIRSTRAIMYYIRDPGAGFKLDELPHAAISNPTDSPAGHVEYREGQGMRPGGFGILLVRNLVDELIYSEKGNEVILIKYLHEGSEPA